jgi:hypothetical protein
VLRLLNVCLGIAVFSTAVWLYQLKYDVRAADRRIAVLEREITETSHDITLLEAEWTYLNRPRRLQTLVENHLDLESVRSEQIIGAEQISTSIRVREAPVLDEEDGDLIGQLLGATQ